MAAYDRITDRQPKAAAGAVGPTGIAGVLFENQFQVSSGNTRARIAHIYPEGVYGRSAFRNATEHRRVPIPSVPVAGLAANLDYSAFWGELAGILQQIDEIGR